MIDSQSLVVMGPEIVVAVVGLVSLIAASACGSRVTRHIGILAVITFILAGGLLFCDERLHQLLNGAMPVFAFGTRFVDDSFARFTKAIILASSACSIMMSWNYFEKNDYERPEYPVLIIFATLGMMLTVSASDLIMLYLGLELQSLALYVLAAFNRDEARSSEAGLKYFVLGALASGILLYGVSLIYGFAGTTDFTSLAFGLRGAAHTNPGVVVGMVFVVAALAFKVSAVPFHMWTPDVYQGAPTPVTVFFATSAKLAALAIFARFLLDPMIGLVTESRQLIIFLSVASMLWGGFAGLVQKDLKRLLAYSAIANIGFLLIGLVVGGKSGLQALLIYYVIYTLNVLGAFAVLLCLRRNGRAVTAIADLSGLSRTNPWIALGMTIIMFSIAGVPPLAGFFGKYFIFLAAIDNGQMPLVMIGVLSSVVTAFYYLHIVKVMYMDEPHEPLDPLPDWGVKSVLGFSSLSMIGITFMPAPLVDGALRAARGFIL